MLLQSKLIYGYTIIMIVVLEGHVSLNLPSSGSDLVSFLTFYGSTPVTSSETTICATTAGPHQSHSTQHKVSFPTRPSIIRKKYQQQQKGGSPLIGSSSPTILENNKEDYEDLLNDNRPPCTMQQYNQNELSPRDLSHLYSSWWDPPWSLDKSVCIITTRQWQKTYIHGWKKHTPQTTQPYLTEGKLVIGLD